MLLRASSSDRRSRAGPRRASETTSGSAYPSVKVVWVRSVPRKPFNTLVARSRSAVLGAPEIGGGDGLGLGLPSGSPSPWSPSVPSPVSVRRRSGPSDNGGLPCAKSCNASSTAGSTTQVTGALPAEEPKSASRERRPSGAVSCTQRDGPLRLPSAARRARSRNGSTTDRGTVRCRASSLGMSGMNVRARPSATRSRPSLVVPSACTPNQYTPGAPLIGRSSACTRTVKFFR